MDHCRKQSNIISVPSCFSVSQISVRFTSLLRVEHSSKREAVSILQTSSTPSDTVSLHTKGPDGASNTAHCKQKPEACIKLHHRERISCPLSAFYQLTAGLAFYSKFSILSPPYCGFRKEFKPCRSFCVTACMFAG